MIEVAELTKRYPSGKGIFDLSFSVREGEVFGFLGPNGAGKTTTIRYLMGFTNATGGRASIDGMDCRTQAAKIQKTLGYIPGEMAFFDNMTGLRFLKFMSELRGNGSDTRRRDGLIAMFELECDRVIRKMSKGMKQKLGLAAAFMHDPAVLILDEPTSGLDPLMQKRFIELILAEKARGKTIFMSSHMFEEIERTCDRAAILREGRLAALEDVQSLKSAQRRVYVVTVGSAADAAKIKAGPFPVQGDGLLLEITLGGELGALLRLLAQCDVRSLNVVGQSLEEIFMQYYGKAGA